MNQLSKKYRTFAAEFSIGTDSSNAYRGDVFSSIHNKNSIRLLNLTGSRRISTIVRSKTRFSGLFSFNKTLSFSQLERTKENATVGTLCVGKRTPAERNTVHTTSEFRRTIYPSAYCNDLFLSERGCHTYNIYGTKLKIY